MISTRVADATFVKRKKRIDSAHAALETQIFGTNEEEDDDDDDSEVLIPLGSEPPLDPSVPN